MANVKQCDGCGAMDDGTGNFEIIGMVSQMDYCAPCVVKAKAYLDERDALHDDLSSRWAGGLGVLKTKHQGNLNVLPS